jgi:predicted dehydrogenase
MFNRTTRRQFLGSAAAGAGTIVIGPYVRGQDASPNETIHLAGIGAGGKGGNDIDNDAGIPGVRVVALCDVDRKTLGKAGEKYPDAKQYDDYRRMFDEMHKDIDAVTVGTPDHHHAPASMMAMQLDKHVYTQKPLTHSIYEARKLAEMAAKKPKLATQMGNQGHCGHGVRQIVELVKQGVVGPIKQVVGWTNRPVWPQGLDRPPAKDAPAHVNWDVWVGPAPERPYHDNLHPFAWRGWWDFGTGALGDMACHILDGAFWAMDLRDPISAEAEGAPVKPECGPNWETITLQYAARGNHPPCTFTWYDGKKDGDKPNQPPADLFEGEGISSGGTLLIGEKGKIYIPDDYCARYQLLPKGKWEGFQAPPPSIPDAFGNNPHTDWIHAIRTGKTGASHFGYAGAFTEMILVGVVAFRVGKKISWDAKAMKAKGCPEADVLINRPYRKGWTL